VILLALLSWIFVLSNSVYITWCEGVVIWMNMVLD